MSSVMSRLWNRRRLIACLGADCLFALFGCAPAAARADGAGEQVVVVYNRNLAPESRQVAEYYARRRGVPERNLIGLSLPKSETMSRTAFRNDLQRPLARVLQERGLARFPGKRDPEDLPGALESRVRYVVLVWGVPLKIGPDASLKEDLPGSLPQQLRRNEAAVDTELACLPRLERGMQLAGPWRNPFFATTNVAAMHPTNGLFLVTRIDGPSAAVAQSLVDRALAAETNGFFGRAYFDIRNLSTNDHYHRGDVWIQDAYRAVRRQGFESVINTESRTFRAWEPLPQIAIYTGWYDAGVSGPFTREPVEFVPGAVAYHLHSFSASSVRTATNHWVGPFLARGVAATMGCVYEPYLDFTPHVGVFFTWLIALRHNFAEAAYAAQPVLSWQTTIIGDPLYRPMARAPQQLHEELERTRSPLLPWSILRVVNLNLAIGEPVSKMIQYLNTLPVTSLSAVLSEKLGDLYREEKQPDRAIERYRAALNLAPSPNQQILLWFKLIETLKAENRVGEALDVYEVFFRTHPNYPELLRFYQQALPLAHQMGNTGLIERYQAEIARLIPPQASDTNAPPQNGESAR